MSYTKGIISINPVFIGIAIPKLSLEWTLVFIDKYGTYIVTVLTIHNTKYSDNYANTNQLICTRDKSQ